MLPHGLTPMQLRCMRLLQDCLDATGGVAPTLEELRAGLGLASKSGVYRLLEGLVDRGYIERIFKRNRAIRIVHRLPDQTAATALADLALVLAAAVPSTDGMVRITAPQGLVDAAIAAIAAKAA